MMLISANPARPKAFKKKAKGKTATGRKAPKKGASAMAKKHRTAAQKAATRRLVALNKSRHGHKPRKTHRNPYRAVSRKRHGVKRHRTHRNPFTLRGGILGEILSKDGLLMVAGAFAAPMATDYLQEKIMPSATGWTKVGVKAALVLAGAWAIDRFLKMRKVALAYGVTGAAVVAADAVNIARGQMAGLSASEADMLANRPDLIAGVASGNLGAPYQTGLSAPYQTGLSSGFGSAFRPAFR